MKNWVVKNLIWGIVYVIGLVLVASVFLNVVTEHKRIVEVPDFNNMSIRDAERFAVQKEVRIEVTDSIYAPRRAKGVVVAQSPRPGQSVKRGRRVMLTTNAVMPKMVTMPNLVGLSMRQAKAELLSRGLYLGRLIYVTDMATNNVLRQLYQNREILPGTQIKSESELDLVVGLSTIDFTTNVPDVVGMKYLRAVDVIHDYSLNVERLRFDSTVQTYDDSLNAVVFTQSPLGTDAACHIGSEVSLSLTIDPEKVHIN